MKKRMDYKAMVIGTFAILAAYIILFMPISFATDVSIYFGTTKLAEAELDPEDKILINVNTDDDDDEVTITVSNNTASHQLSQVVIYKCQGLGPADCISTKTPDSFSGNTQRTYGWSELADTTTGYPQTGYLIVLVELPGAVGTWNGFIYKIYKYDQHSGFDPVESKSLSNIDLYSLSGDSSLINKIGDFIETNGMIPFNPDWTIKVVLTGAMGFHEIYSSNPPAGFLTETETNYELTGLFSNYSLAFPLVGSEFYNPITFNLNPSYTCGNGNCESGLGEHSGNCCYDCGCYVGHYCDLNLGCRGENIIGLGLVGQQQTGIEDCRSEHMINVHAEVIGAPTGMVVTGQYYKLGSQQTQAAVCTESGGVYDCPITVPADPGCSGGDYELGPNSLIFNISYPDGPNTKTQTLTKPFPDIVVGSWTCGLAGCEATIGEDWSNCCYDCPCTGENEYCDYYEGNFSSTRCMPDLMDVNLQVLDVDPTDFYVYNGVTGDSITFLAQITNKPRSLSPLITPGCSISCFTDESAPCTVSCGVSCSSLASQSPGIYNSTCSMSFYISDYAETETYHLQTALNYNITYENGSSADIDRTLSNEFAEIVVHEHWCGDGVCTSDESPDSCCFDCACPSGQYCDTQNPDQPNASDMCRPLGPIDLSISQPHPLEFLDSMFQHAIDVSVHINNTPSSAALSPVCSFAGGDVMCSASCQPIDSSGDSICEIIVPSMDYKTSPYYDNTTNRIILSSNTLDMVLEFSDGFSTANKSFAFSIPTVRIEPTFHCGNDECEVQFNESWQNCCIDCPCLDANEYCYTDQLSNLAGQCFDANEINLVLTGVDPAVPNCTIQYYRERCQFMRPLNIRAVVPRAPDDMEVITEFYEFDGTNHDLLCYSDPHGQNENYTCATVLPPIDGEDGGELDMDFRLWLTVRYTANGTTRVQNISAAIPDFGVNRVKSERVMACERVKDELDSKEAKLERDKTMLYVFLGIATAIATYICWSAYTCCAATPACGACAWLTILCGIALMVVGCIGGMLNSKVEQLQSEVEQLEQQEMTLCQASDAAGLRSALGGVKDTGMSMLGITLGVVCAVGAIVAMNGLGQMISAPPAPSGVPPGANQPQFPQFNQISGERMLLV